MYLDTFAPRPFQHELIASVLDGMASGRKLTVGLAAPGSGKTLAYQAGATRLYREFGVKHVAVFVPRINLARQCETKWMYLYDGAEIDVDRKLFDARQRIDSFKHIPNDKSYLPTNGQAGKGFVTTYSALATTPSNYLDWAKRHAGQFLLVADEAQFCGADDENGNGTRAGALIAELHQYSAHTLLLTGTPERSDGQPLVLAGYGEPNENRVRPLLFQVEATYQTGVAEGYLRPFEATMHDAKVLWKAGKEPATEHDLSDDSDHLREVLRQPLVWQPIVDDVVEAVRDKQKVNRAYRGLISCMEQKDAKRVAEYLATRHPGVRVTLAISEHGAAADHALDAFKIEGDVLVTVRKAFIGYDCPEITVVGVLTNYRDLGHLLQLVGRGLRVWDGEGLQSQSCRVITPDDLGMQVFVEFMRIECELGLRERGHGGTPPGGNGQLGYVEDAWATTVRAESNDVTLESEELALINAAREELGLTDDPTKLARFWDLLSSQPPTVPVVPPPSRPDAPPLTEQDQIKKIKAETAEVIREVLSRRGIYGNDPRYGDYIMDVTAEVNARAGYTARQVRTVAQAQARLDAARALL